jgi:hypothetical protein
MMLCVGGMNAGGPMAVYALVDRLVLESNADKRERIRIGVPSVSRETQVRAGEFHQRKNA